MSYDFNADEVFEMAEQLERNGGKFYRSAAENADNSENRSFLLELAKMEDQHEKTFKAMRAELPAKAKESKVFDPQGEAALYLRALADTRVFFEKKNRHHLDVGNSQGGHRGGKRLHRFLFGDERSRPGESGKRSD